MGGCMGQWVGSGQMTNLIKLELINIIWFCLKIYNLSRHPYLWVDGWVNGWAHVKPLKSNKSWPNRDNSIIDILDILLDILLKPPQPFIGLFFMVVTASPNISRNTFTHFNSTFRLQFTLFFLHKYTLVHTSLQEIMTHVVLPNGSHNSNRIILNKIPGVGERTHTRLLC